MLARRYICTLKFTAAIQQYRDRVAAHVRNGDISVAVAVHVTANNCYWRAAGRQRRPAAEAAGAVAIQNRDCILAEVRSLAGEVLNRKIKFAIAVEIANRHAKGVL